MEHPAPPTRPAPSGRHAKTILPAEVHSRLGHLAIDLGCSQADLLVEGAILVCRYHSQGDGLPEPMPPRGEPDRNVATGAESVR
jgi:hypothetical protein